MNDDRKFQQMCSIVDNAISNYNFEEFLTGCNTLKFIEIQMESNY